MKHTGRILLGLIVLLAVVAGCQEQAAKEQASGVGGLNPTKFNILQVGQELDVNGLAVMNVPTVVGTATPALRIESSGVGNPLEIRKASTPVFYVDVDGNVTYTGMSSGGGAIANAVALQAPTAVATNTPAFSADTLGAGNNIFEARKAATPLFSIQNSGAVVASGGSTWGNAVYAAVPTAVATATPALFANSAGGVSNIFELRQAATPVAAVQADGDWIIGPADGTGVDVTFWSDTSGDYMLWDQSEEQLKIIGTNGATALDVSDGNVVVNDNLTVTAGAFDVTAGATTLEALSTGVDGTGADVYFYSDTAGDWLFYDQANEALTIIGTNGQDALNVDDGNVDIADNVDIDGTLDVAGAVALAADVTLSAPSTGNNAGGRVEYIGLPRIKLVGLDGGTNPGSQTIACIDANPTGEWAEVDAGTNLALTANTSYFRDSTNSVKLAFTDVVDNDGADGTIAQVDLGDMEYLGFWIYSDAAISSADFDVTLDDTDGTDQTYNVGAVSANVWTWIELDISACGANCNTVDGIKFLATTQGGTALTAANVYLDAMYVWDDADQDDLGAAILQDGVLGCIDPVTGEDLVEWTNFFVRYTTGNEFLVWITDESAAFPFALVAY